MHHSFSLAIYLRVWGNNCHNLGKFLSTNCLSATLISVYLLSKKIAPLEFHFQYSDVGCSQLPCPHRKDIILETLEPEVEAEVLPSCNGSQRLRKTALKM